MKNPIAIAALFCIALTVKGQQDPQYNLYQFNQMIINPAYAGSRDGLSLVAMHRQQWLDFPGAPVTTCFSAHGPVFNKTLGLGLTLTKDAMGPRDVIGAYGNVAYILRLSPKMKLAFGINAGYNKYQFNFSKLNMQTAELPSQLTENLNPGSLDINSGLFLRSSTFFIGLSATHLNSRDVYSFEQVNGKYTYKIHSHYFITVGNSWMLNENLIFAPTVLVKSVQNVMSADINLNFFMYKKLWLGVFYRNAYGPGALFQYYITNRFRVAYSYDTGLQDALRLGGSHEIMLGFDFAGTKTKMINPRFL